MTEKKSTPKTRANSLIPAISLSVTVNGLSRQGYLRCFRNDVCGIEHFQYEDRMTQQMMKHTCPVCWDGTIIPLRKCGRRILGNSIQRQKRKACRGDPLTVDGASERRCFLGYTYLTPTPRA